MSSVGIISSGKFKQRRADSGIELFRQVLDVIGKENETKLYLKPVEVAIALRAHEVFRNTMLSKELKQLLINTHKIHIKTQCPDLMVLFLNPSSETDDPNQETDVSTSLVNVAEKWELNDYIAKVYMTSNLSRANYGDLLAIAEDNKGISTSDKYKAYFASEVERVEPPSGEEKVETRICNMGARVGDLEFLEWARAKNDEWDAFTCALAAENGHLELLQWARANGCEWDEWTCASAARNGHLEVLKWA